MGLRAGQNLSQVGFDSQTVQSIASIIPTNYTSIDKDRFAVRVVNSFLQRTDLKILICVCLGIVKDSYYYLLTHISTLYCFILQFSIFLNHGTWGTLVLFIFFFLKINMKEKCRLQFS